MSKTEQYQEIQHASKSVQGLQEALHGLHEDAVTRSQQLVHMHEEDTLAYREVASTLHNSLESIVDKDMARLYQRMMTFDASLVCIRNKRLIEQILTGLGMDE